MTGYKRVNFYELCRLCATNQQKEKTHIFQEEGRKIQLQTKIQSCLSLTVCENDFLPKVVCSRCLRTLEVCYFFRQECVTSESMLSSYFKNFRYTEDFKKSGKVYIKDTTSKCSLPQFQQNPEPVTSTTPQNITTTNNNNINYAQSVIDSKPTEHVPFYTLQLPTIVTNQSAIKTENKTIQNQNQQGQQLSYNLNTINLQPMKTVSKSEPINNVVVNASGEVLNIAQLVDFESIINHASPRKVMQNIKRRIKDSETEPSVIKIDLTNGDLEANAFDTGQTKFDKMPQLKHKYQYAIKMEENKVGNINPNNPTVIFNTEFSQPTPSTFNGYTNGANIYNSNPNQALNVVNSNHILNENPIESTSSTVNLNVLNQDFGTQRNVGISQTNFVQITGGVQKVENVQGQQAKSFACDACSKSFKRREHLYQHLRLHTGIRPYSCENCNKSFMRKEHLLRHMTSHSGLKNFTCSICDKSFSRNDNLLKHKKTHDKQASYTCEVCQKQFVMKHYYLAHKLTHDGDNKCVSSNVWNVLKA